MLCGGGAIQDSVAVWGPLDVAQPTWPVGVAHQVGVESDGIIAGITCGRPNNVHVAPLAELQLSLLYL